MRTTLPSGSDVASFWSVWLPWCDAMPFAALTPILLLPFGPDSERIMLYSVDEDKAFSLPPRGKVPYDASCRWLVLMDEPRPSRY